MNNLTVSVIIPCRNEKKYIGKCLDTILEQDYPKEKIEVLVIDGMSEDKSREIIKNYSVKFPFIKLLENPKKFTNFAFNIGVKESKGRVIMIMGAHAGYKKDYISKCVKYLKEYDADNVGGVMKTLPSKDTVFAKAIAICLSHFFGAGGSWFRTGSKEIRLVDTVFGGCYKKEVFDKVGLFNENLLRSQDMEFNLRLKKAGGKIILAPDIVFYYYPSPTLKEFYLHNFEDGIWAILPLKFMKRTLKLRHYIPLFFVLSLPLSIWLYIPISIYFSVRISFREKNFRLFFIMPIVFATRHIGYGLGSIWGAIKLII